MAINVFIKLASKFKSDLRRQFKDSMTYPQAAGKPDHKSAKETANKAFDYIEKSANPTQAKNRAQEMFGDFDIDGAIEEAGGFDKAFKITKPLKKKDGGWIQGAIKKPGALRKQLGVKEGEKIPMKKLNAAAKEGGKLGQRARLAKTLRGFKNGGIVTKWENKWS